ncbi:MAG: hypothetical protein V4858_24395 [Pseudomonadota bacterium]
MKTIAFFIYLVATFCCPSVRADELEDFGDQMSYFYLAPSQESFNTFQKNADRFRDRIEGGGNRADILVAVMIAKISQAHNWQTGDGVFGKRAKEINEGHSRFARYIVDDAQVDPTKLDIWWASFFATGNERFLENIFQYAGAEPAKGDIGRTLVIGAASWSFKANCGQHKKVLEFARRKLNTASLSEAQTKFAKESVAFAETKSGEPAAVGDVAKTAR